MPRRRSEHPQDDRAPRFPNDSDSLRRRHLATRQAMATRIAGALRRSSGRRTAPESCYAGYYVDQRQGGIIHVGFTSGQGALVSELKSQAGLLAPARVEPSTMQPTTSLRTLGSALGELPGKLDSRPDIIRILSKAQVDTRSNSLNVAATNPTAAEGYFSSALSGTPITVSLAPSKPVRKGLPRSRPKDQKLYGGDWISGPGAYCSVGFGASEALAKKPNQEQTFAHFALTAGHCWEVGASIGRVFGRVPESRPRLQLGSGHRRRGGQVSSAPEPRQPVAGD